MGRLSAWQERVVQVTRAMPVNPVGRRLALWLRKPVLLTLHGEEIETEVLGLKLRLQPADNVSERRVLFMPQFFDPEERAYLAAKVAAQPTLSFLDLGANAGLYALLAARLSGDRAQVLAVEPQPEMVRRLKTNIALNGFRNIQLAEAAAAEQEGPVELVLSDTNRGEASLRGGTGVRVTVAGKTLLQLMDEAGMARADILKIDIEGMEDKILTAFFATAPEARWPRAMFLENNPQRWQSDCVALCLARGYKRVGAHKMNLILERDVS